MPYATNPDYLGVRLNLQSGRYLAILSYNGKRIRIGSKFLTAEGAAHARDRRAIELYGDAAILNFPLETYQ